MKMGMINKLSTEITENRADITTMQSAVATMSKLKDAQEIIQNKMLDTNDQIQDFISGWGQLFFGISGIFGKNFTLLWSSLLEVQKFGET